jgi:hypothetical protein
LFGVFKALANAALASALAGANFSATRRNAGVARGLALARLARPAGRALALAAHAGAVVSASAQQAIVTIAREVVALAERTRNVLKNVKKISHSYNAKRLSKYIMYCT